MFHPSVLRTASPVKCEICKEDQGRVTYIIGDNWITCDRCKQEKKEAEKEIQEEKERCARLCIELDKKRERDPENWSESSEYYSWSESGDRIRELEKAFRKKYYGY